MNRFPVSLLLRTSLLRNSPLVLLVLLSLATALPASASPARSRAPAPAAPAAPAAPSALAAPAASPRLATLNIPGDRRFALIARDIIDARMALNPDLASSVGLFEDAVRVPSYTPAAVAALDARLAQDLAVLTKMRWRGWSVDAQIDYRWVWANAEEARRRLTVERMWEHRYGEYLEPVANTFISLTTYAPERVDLRVQLAALLPGMITEMLAQVTAPTQRDVTTGLGLLDGLDAVVAQLPEGAERQAAAVALTEARTQLNARSKENLPEFKVIGHENYNWRLKHVLLLPWDSAALLEHAQAELTRVDAALAALKAAEFNGVATPAESEAAAAMDRAGFLKLYDDVVARNLAALRAMDVVTVPADLPAMHCRETPAALLPLTGDGGSMNPPLAFPSLSSGLSGGSAAPVGWWNVQHYSADWTLAEREALIVSANHPELSGLGPYAVHEGVPGHHLQLSMLPQLNNPIHAILQDGSAVEGWALYAEQLFWEGGGFGDSNRAHANMLRSYRSRIRRVFYDTYIESGDLTLQQGADWKAGTAPGVTAPDADVLRSIQWPTQLITYFAGKSQILALRDEVRERQGAAYSERAFNDALLAEGPIPIALIRAKMLGEPVPDVR